MKKRIFVFLAVNLISLSLFAQVLRVGLLNGPTCIPAAYLMENDSEYQYETFSDPQALLPKMLKKEIDVGFMPLNVAAKVYNSGNKAIICCAVTGLGNLSVITTDKSLRNFSELKGKTVYTAGQGATPEYMLCYLLKENNLTYSTDGSDADVKLDFSIPTAQLAAQLISGKIQYAVVPEPFTTIAKMKSDKISAPVDLQIEYMKISGSQTIYPLSVMVVRNDYARENPEKLEAFLQEYQKAVEWTIANPSEAGKLSQKHSLGLEASVVEKAIPVSNYTFIPTASAIKMSEELLEIFGGKLPDREFYYDGKNLR